MKTAVVIDGVKDNVATIISHEIKKGSVIPVEVEGKTIEVTANADIPFGHKVAIHPIKAKETVFKYGLSIGNASVDIAVGDHVHVHNIDPVRGRGDLAKKGE
ncbi:MAG: UxaA family hydrolase [Dehalobacterium sp.]